MDRLQQRSTFVTVVACIFLVLAGFGTLVGIMQGVMLLLMREELAAVVHAPVPSDMPEVFRWMFRAMPAMFAAMLLANVATFASAIGLLQRRNWGRVAFIAMMALGIAWNIAAVVLNIGLTKAMMEQLPAITMAGEPDLRAVFVVGMVAGSAVSIAIAVLFGWIIRRLCAPAIVAELRA